MRKVASMLAGRAAVVMINSQESPGLAGRYGVRGIPVIFLLRQGRVVDQLTGTLPAEEIFAWFRNHAIS